MGTDLSQEDEECLFSCLLHYTFKLLGIFDQLVSTFMLDLRVFLGANWLGASKIPSIFDIPADTI